jgi:uncharacterized protein involved in exopolysaccharide biosynthesis
MPDMSQFPAATASARPALSDRSAVPTPSSDSLEYLRLAWRRRHVTIVAALVLAAAGAAVSLVAPRRYEASVTVAVMTSRLTPQTETAPGAVADFIPVVSSYAAAAPVVKEFKLDAPPRLITTSTFLREVLTVRPIELTKLVRVVVELDDPDLAAKVSNRLVENAIALSRAVNDRELTWVASDLQRLLGEAEARMKDAERRYDEYRRTAQLELLKKDVDTLLLQRALFKNLMVDIEAERGKVVQGEAELAKRERITTLKRSIDDDPALLATAQERRQPQEDVLGLELKSDFVSNVYENIDAHLAESRARLSSLERQRDELLKGARVGGGELARLNELYARESELSRLELERTIARKTFEDVSGRFQTARLQAVGRTSQAVVVDAAVPPDRPVSRLLARNIVLGLAAGLFVGLVVAATDLLRRRTTDPPSR